MSARFSEPSPFAGSIGGSVPLGSELKHYLSHLKAASSNNTFFAQRVREV